MHVGTTETKVDDLVGKYLTIDGECVEIVECNNSQFFILNALRKSI